MDNNIITIKGLQDTKIEILQDTKKKNGNIWKEKRALTEKLLEMYKKIDKKKAERLKDCGTFLEFKKLADNSMKLHKANFCKVRLCPMCSWRRSEKIFAQVSKIMDVAEQDNYRFLFLTLTIENCQGEDLKNTIDGMLEGFDRMFRLKKIKDTVKGWFRALEVTYNKDKNTYHPHLHICLAVKSSYFKKTYISQATWSDIWRKSVRVDYTPICHIQTIKNGKKGVCEASKYAVKSTDILGSLEVLKILDKCLNKRRLIAFGGLFKKLQKELNLDDAEDGNLVNVETDFVREDLNFVIERYVWGVGVYGRNYYKLSDSVKVKNDKIEKSKEDVKKALEQKEQEPKKLKTCKICGSETADYSAYKNGVCLCRKCVIKMSKHEPFEKLLKNKNVFASMRIFHDENRAIKPCKALKFTRLKI